MAVPERVDNVNDSGVQEHDHEHEDDTLYCTVHPTIATNLRCNRCGRPMCTKCAVRTPVGYRCRECVREQQDTFFTAHIWDYLIAAGVALVMSFFAAMFISWIRFFLLAIFLSPAAGGVIGTVVMRLTGKRRGRHTAWVVGAAVIMGALPFLLANLLGIGIYIVMATGAAITPFRLRL